MPRCVVTAIGKSEIRRSVSDMDVRAVQWLQAIAAHFGAMMFRVSDNAELGSSQFAFMPWPGAPTVECDDCHYRHTVLPKDEDATS